MCGSGSVFRIRIQIQEAPEYGSNTDPDLQHWLKVKNFFMFSLVPSELKYHTPMPNHKLIYFFSVLKYSKMFVDPFVRQGLPLIGSLFRNQN